MGKGNWERRAAMAAAKRELAREKKKEKRSLISRTSLDSIISKLALLSQNVLVWLGPQKDGSLPDPGDFNVCSNWFRFDDCSNKKCKLHHSGLQICALRGLPNSLEDGSKRVELGCTIAIPLIELAPSDLDRILFMSVNGQCVFDHTDFNVWENFWSATETNQGATSMSLPTVYENGGILESTSTTDVESSTGEPEAAAAVGHEERYISSLLDDYSLVGLLISYLEFDDLTSLLSCGRHCHHRLSKHEYFRKIKKEQEKKHFVDNVRHKKMDHKKKAKSMWLKKVDKKDAFARGMRL